MNAIINIIEKCDIYFEGMLISKEKILKTYADHISSGYAKDRSVAFEIHTGSLCFYCISVLLAGLNCIALDTTTPEEILEYLIEDDMVLYQGERHLWKGFIDYNGTRFAKIIQNNKVKGGKPDIRMLPQNLWSKIRPYYGASTLTDGRGIRQTITNRLNFLSYVLDVDKANVPGEPSISMVVMSDKHLFERVYRGISIRYENDINIDFSEVITASYYNDISNSHIIGSNPTKAIPILKVTNKMSVARELILEKSNFQPKGLLVMGIPQVDRNISEIVDLLDRQSLRFINISTEIDSEQSRIFTKEYTDADVFATTKAYLLSEDNDINVQNDLTIELNNHLNNIISNEVVHENVHCNVDMSDFAYIKNILFSLKQEDTLNSNKENFIVGAYYLLKLFSTAVFPIKCIEEAIEKGLPDKNILSPTDKLLEISDYADAFEGKDGNCHKVIEALYKYYDAFYSESAKYNTLLSYIENSNGDNVAVIVPKAYYKTLLEYQLDGLYENIHVTTAKKLDVSIEYKYIILVGDFGCDINSINSCKFSGTVIVLLYDCEKARFMYQMRNSARNEQELNRRLGIETHNDPIIENDQIFDHRKYEELAKQENDLDRFIATVGRFDITKFSKTYRSTGNIPESEVLYTGSFANGEQILFSRYYNALVLDEYNQVYETSPEKLNIGDALIFMKHNEYSRNIIDYLMYKMNSEGRLPGEISEAIKRSEYWKNTLRAYKDENTLSYKQLAKKFKNAGSSLQEGSIRMWICEDSNIIGPQSIESFRLIGVVTGDEALNNNPEAYFDACRIVRKQRKEFAKYVMQSIINKFIGGDADYSNEITRLIHSNIDNLAEIYELSSISELEEVMSVPIYLVNRPIDEEDII